MSGSISNIFVKKICRPLVVATKSAYHKPASKRILHLAADPHLFRQRRGRIFIHEIDPISHYRNFGSGVVRCCPPSSGGQTLYLVAFQMPFGKKAIACKPETVRRAVIGTVKIDVILASDRAEFF